MADALEEANLGPEGGNLAKDLFSGAVGGVAQVLIGQPFDIVKVRLQTTTQYTGALDCARRILANEGASAFYKGTLTPLIGIGACVSVQFGAFNYAKRFLESRNASSSTSSSTSSTCSSTTTSSSSSSSSSSSTSSSSSPTTSPPPLSYAQYYTAGAFAGLANTLLSSPIEHVRIRLQTQPHTTSSKLYSGPLDCIAQLSRSPSVARGLYRGTPVTLLREAQAYGFWFLTFEYLMNTDVRRNGIERKEVPTWKVAVYGGLAGEMLWISSYPFDVVKSKLQTDALRVGERRFASARDCAVKTLRAEGWRGFWRGVGPTLLRAMPVSAGTFAVVEMTMRAIS